MKDKLKYLEQAQRYLLKGNVERAILEYRKAVELDPNDNITRLRLGELLGKAGRKNEAAEEFIKVADAYSRRGFYMQAIAAYKHVLKVDPMRIDINEKIGDLYRKQGLVGEAVAQYLGVLRHLEKEKRISEALELIKKIFETDPSNYLMRSRLVMICWKEGLKDHAIQELDKIHKELMAKRLFSEAQEIYTGILEEFPGNIDLLEKLCDTYFRMGEREKALEVLTTINQICLEKGKPDLIRKISKKFEISAEEFTKGERYEEPPAEVPVDEVTEGELILKELEKESARAEGEFDLREKILSIPEKDKYSFESVFEEFKKGIAEQLSREDYESHYDLGIAYKEMGLYDDAIGEFKIAMADSEKRISSILMISSCLINKGEGEEACRLLEETISEGELEKQEIAALKYQLALAYKASGRIADALTVMEEVYNMDSEFMEVKKELLHLRKLAKEKERA